MRLKWVRNVENGSKKNARTSTLWIYYRNYKEVMAQAEMVTEYGSGYGKNDGKVWTRKV